MNAGYAARKWHQTASRAAYSHVTWFVVVFFFSSTGSPTSTPPVRPLETVFPVGKAGSHAWVQVAAESVSTPPQCPVILVHLGVLQGVTKPANFQGCQEDPVLLARLFHGPVATNHISERLSNGVVVPPRLASARDHGTQIATYLPQTHRPPQ